MAEVAQHRTSMFFPHCRCETERFDLSTSVILQVDTEEHASDALLRCGKRFHGHTRNTRDIKRHNRAAQIIAKCTQ